jgi:hypothetical protein
LQPEHFTLCGHSRRHINAMTHSSILPLFPGVPYKLKERSPQGGHL